MEDLDYARVGRAVRFVEEHAAEQPSLEEVAAHVGLSPYHFQRLFRRWAGVSPKRFLQYLTVESAKELLRGSASVLDAALEVGLSGPSRLHDLFVSVESVTPGEYKRFGEGLELRYGLHRTPFGDCLAAVTERGLCSLAFVDDDGRAEAFDALAATWREAALVEDPAASCPVIEQIFGADGPVEGRAIRVLLRGTRFQLKVWEALLRIPEGAFVSYGALAAAVGHPGASRAVGNAVGENPIAYLIPCHRVLRASGQIGGYRWGTTRKRALVAREAARQSPRLTSLR